MRPKTGHSMMRGLPSTHHAEEQPKPRALPDRHAEHQKLRIPPNTLLAQTSRLEPPASDQLQSRSPCSERQHRPACQPPREPQRSAQTTDARHTGLLETRSRGRSQTLLYNTRRPHQALEGMTPDQAYFTPQQLPAAAQPNAEASLKKPGKLFRRMGPPPCLTRSTTSSSC